MFNLNNGGIRGNLAPIGMCLLFIIFNFAGSLIALFTTPEIIIDENSYRTIYQTANHHYRQSPQSSQQRVGRRSAAINRRFNVAQQDDWSSYIEEFLILVYAVLLLVMVYGALYFKSRFANANRQGQAPRA